MGRRKRQIEELNAKLEEIIRINEDLKLENAEFRAKFGMLGNENPVVKVEEAEQVAPSFESSLQIRDFSADTVEDEEINLTESEIADFIASDDYEVEEEEEDQEEIEAFLNEPSVKTVFENVALFGESAKEEKSEPVKNVAVDAMKAEISELREQNIILLNEMESIKLLLKNEINRPEPQPQPQFQSQPDNQYAQLANSMGKLIVDSQIGAAKIIDEAKKEALRHIENAKREALEIRNKSDEKNEKISKKLGSAKKDIDNIIDKMEDLSENISSAKHLFDSDSYEQD